LLVRLTQSRVLWSCASCPVMSDWVWKPPFTAVLWCKTVAWFNLDPCATRNLTVLPGV
jgi:hypothetical protein